MITVAHEPSITALKVAREIFDALLINKPELVLKRLDQSKKKWSKGEIKKMFLKHGCDLIGDWCVMKKSASPVIEYDDTGFTYRHLLPGPISWHKVALTLRFSRRARGSYHIELIGLCSS